MLNSYKQRCKWKIIEAGMLPPKTVKTRSCTHRDGGAKGAEYSAVLKENIWGQCPLQPRHWPWAPKAGKFRQRRCGVWGRYPFPSGLGVLGSSGLGVLGSIVSSPNGVWDGAPAETYPCRNAEPRLTENEWRLGRVSLHWESSASSHSGFRGWAPAANMFLSIWPKVAYYSEAKASVPGESNKPGDWVIEYPIFLQG